MGCRVGKPDGDADSSVIREAWDRDGKKPGGTNSRSLSPPGRMVLLGSGGNHRDGDRSRGIYWRGHRFQTDPRRFAPSGRSTDGDCHFPYSDVAAAGAKTAGTGHRRSAVIRCGSVYC
ncbi:hypothetical protein D3C72_2024550 [compost metagenome]